MTRPYCFIQFGALPIDLINSTLGTELEAGNAILTARAHEHIATDHPEDYALVMANLGLLISDPTYIGQSPSHGGSFEMVRRLVAADGNEIVLAAVNLSRNRFGNYNVLSAYRLTERHVTSRVAKRHLLMPKKKGPG